MDAGWPQYNRVTNKSEKGGWSARAAPGLGIDIVEEAMAKYPSKGNSSEPDATYDYQYFAPRTQRALWFKRRGDAATGISGGADILKSRAC